GAPRPGGRRDHRGPALGQAGRRGDSHRSRRVPYSRDDRAKGETRAEGPVTVGYTLAQSPMSRPSDSTRADVGAIRVAVTFSTDLRRFRPRGAEGPQRYRIPEGSTAADLLAAIGVEPGAEVTIAVDGELGSRETPLRDGSDVMLLNPMEGGAAARWRSRSPLAEPKPAGGAAAAGEATSQTARRPARHRGDNPEGEATTQMEGG